MKTKFISLKKADDGKHKYVVSVMNGKTGRINNIKFGAFGMSDFTQHKDDKRKMLYDLRHNAREDWSDPLTAGFWSKWILWNKETVDSSLKNTLIRFGL